MNIIIIGSLNIDHVYQVAEFVRPGQTIEALSLSHFAGGKGLNQAVAVGKAGGKAAMAGAIGTDGRELLALLEQSGVDSSKVQVTDQPTGHAIIQVDTTGQNNIIIYGGANRTLKADYIRDVLQPYNAGDLVLLQNETNATESIIDLAKEKGLLVALNPSPITDSLKKIDYTKVDYLILNEIEGFVLSGEKEPENILAYFKKNFPQCRIVLTLGKDGAHYSYKNEHIFQAIYPVHAVDTTAAGDTFTGYFLASISKGYAVANAMKYASAASALAVSRKGAAPSIPLWDEVEQFLKEK